LSARQNSPNDKTFAADVLGFSTPDKAQSGGGHQADNIEKGASTTVVNGASRDQPSQRPVTRSLPIEPESPASSTFSTKSEPQQYPGAMPRNSSIDSAISSISTASQPKSSGEIKDASIAEIRNLIATAGSAENLVQHLLRDKQQAASHNAQLWRLVDKQRALLLGLNTDLERLTKEKERYKKKLKEVQEHALSRAESRPRKDSQSPLAANDVKPTILESTGRAAKSREGQNDLLSTPDNKQRHVLDSSPIDPAMVPSPLHRPQQPRGNEQAEAEGSDVIPLIIEEDRSTPSEPFSRSEEGDLGLTTRHGTEPAPSPLPYTESEQPKPTLLTASLGPPSFALIEPSPLNASSNSTFPPTRKAPPAPLQLEQPGSDALLEGDPIATEDSEILTEDSTIPVDSPTSLRGRRKTREEDDRDREAAVLAEKEARSRSKKEKSKSPVVEIEEADTEALLKPTFLPVGLPSSPRHPPPSLQGGLAHAGSISGVLQGNASAANSSTEGTLSPRPLSPGLPISPRPTDRPPGSPLPRKPRESAAVGNSLPLSPRSIVSGFLSPRAPKQPILLPASPRPNQQTHNLLPSRIPNREVERETHPLSPTGAPEVYQGLISEEYPDFLLPPNALPSIQIKVTSSRLRPSRLSFIGARPQEDNSIFTLSVFSRSDGQELWRLEKVILALPQLDQRLRPLCTSIPSLPDRKLFNGHSPAIIDARRAALDQYFDALLDTEMDEDAAKLVCGFLSTDVIEPRDNGASGLGNTDVGDSTVSIGPDGRPRRTGYLTKRGKNFGGWKARHFVLESPELRYFESPGGAHLGTIKLLNAQIGRQSHSESPTQNPEEDNQYRHAFLILEPKRKDSASHVRHVLCAESDKERDEWVDALLQYVDETGHSSSNGLAPSQSLGSRSMFLNPSLSSLDRDTQSEDSQLRGIQYEDTVAGAEPVKATDHQRDPALPGASTSGVHGQHSLNISGPIGGTVIADAGQWGNRPAAVQAPKEKEQRKRNLFYFKQKNSSDILSQGGSSGEHSQSTLGHPQSSNVGPKVAVRPVFGQPLIEAVEFCPPIGVDVRLPAVVYRCIEYLREKQAANEEGLFRLSGSNVLIRMLKERFNTEGDVDLLADEEYYDVHAVASLFKTYLRELPNPILTRELHIEFLRVLDLEDHAQKVSAYSSLVQRLPSVNYSLLRTLAEYLLHVVNNADKNKMSIRNVGIVFSPTLNIPAPVFAIFLTDFAAVFGKEASQQKDHSAPLGLADSNQLSPEDIRSPRRQLFSELPTPSYSQSFSRGPTDGSSQSSASQSSTDTGFIPVQQSYDSRSHGLQTNGQQQQHSHLLQQSSQNAEYGSLNRMLAPEHNVSAKAKRRESSMLFLG
jgi:RalA-binding protein 1